MEEKNVKLITNTSKVEAGVDHMTDEGELCEAVTAPHQRWFNVPLLSPHNHLETEDKIDLTQCC